MDPLQSSAPSLSSLSTKFESGNLFRENYKSYIVSLAKEECDSTFGEIRIFW